MEVHADGGIVLAISIVVFSIISVLLLVSALRPRSNPIPAQAAGPLVDPPPAPPTPSTPRTTTSFSPVWYLALRIALILGAIYLLFFYWRIQDMDLIPDRRPVTTAAVSEGVPATLPAAIQLPPSEFRYAPTLGSAAESGTVPEMIVGHPGFRLCPYESGKTLAQILPNGSFKKKAWQDDWSKEARPMKDWDGMSVDAIRFWSAGDAPVQVQADFILANQTCPEQPSR